MTGFGQAAGTFEGINWIWELKSVNGRSLDLRFRLPPGFDDIELQLREHLSKNFTRGSISVILNLDRPQRDYDVRINESLVKKIAHVASEANLPAPGLEGLLNLKGVVEVVEAKDSEEFREHLVKALLTGLDDAIGSLKKARQAEGAIIMALFISQIEMVEDIIAQVDTHASRQPQTILKRLKEQMEPLLENTGLDEARLHQEAALIAIRSDIQEEIDRLRAHCDHFRGLMKEGGAIGRRLDFLAQEFNRETNTLCSKAHDKDLTTLGLSLKNVIDQFREQAQNVE